MKRLALLAALLLPLSMAFAQQNVGFKTDKVEPLVINPDNSVTFYVEAPKAKSVSVKGDWEANEGNGQMTKGKNGIWSYTTPPLSSEMYTYRLNIDGIYNIAPNNPFSCRDVGTLFSLFYINGEMGIIIKYVTYLMAMLQPLGITRTSSGANEDLAFIRLLFTIRTSSLIPFCTCYMAVAATRTLGWSLAVPPVSWIT